MSNAKRAIGTRIQIGADIIGELTEIPAPELTSEEIDVTTLGSLGGFREFIQGYKDSNTIDLTGFFYTGDIGQSSMKTAYDTGNKHTFIITYPDDVGATWTFDGFVQRFMAGTATVEDPLGFESTVRISGEAQLGTEESAGASAIAVTQSGGTALTNVDITPAFSGSTYNNTVTFDTNTEYVVNITAVDHSILLYKNGDYLETLTSGVESSLIAIAADETQNLQVLCTESAKTSVLYNITVARTA